MGAAVDARQPLGLAGGGDRLGLSVVLGVQRQTCAGVPCCPEQLLCAPRISYCTTDKLQNKVFAYVAQSQDSGALECHAFLSPKKKIVSTSLLLWALRGQGGSKDFPSAPLQREGRDLCAPQLETEPGNVCSHTAGAGGERNEVLLSQFLWSPLWGWLAHMAGQTPH